jgi:hypothetical protein
MPPKRAGGGGPGRAAAPPAPDATMQRFFASQQVTPLPTRIAIDSMQLLF